MKPRVIMSSNGLRIVRTYGSFQLEQANGCDLLGRVKWDLVSESDLEQKAGLLLYGVGIWLVRREKAARKARRARGGK
jgi:hypothetical protein